MAEKGEGTANRLAKESSPYLRQHAHNPVDWFPWGEEAFEKARREDKPIFLSIGYSSCHWCHVMERESFEDKDVARMLNRFYVSIKVDREERPDIDAIYMTTAQMLSGQGGWPLTIFMTPDKRPFFAATYLPKESQQGTLGLLDLLPALADFWKERRGELETSASRVVLALKSVHETTAGKELGRLVFDNAFQALLESFDEHWAGFGTAPKFPTPHHLTFLLRYWQRTKERMALFIVDRTLEAMRHGGIFDQVGFGFHRYSTDRKWIVPHFEKMLYDQALLAMAYLECYQANGKEEFARTVRHVFEYVLRDMTSPQGAFFSAEDADSEGIEGKFYLWTEDELKNILDPDEKRLVLERFDVQAEGNYEEGMPGEKKGDNILHLMNEFHDPGASGKDDPLFLSAVRKLFEAREKRIRPMRDEKILLDWNGLMIAAMSIGARVLSDDGYRAASERCADLLSEKASLPDGRVKHVLQEENSIPGFLSDHIFLAWGLLELYETTFEAKYLKRAIELAEATIAHFWDSAGGGFFDTSNDSEKLLTRQKHAHDGAIPSGNSIAALVLFKLYLITEREEFKEHALKTERAFSKSISSAPQSHTQFLNAIDLIIGPTYEISLIGPKGNEMDQMLSTLASKFVPKRIVAAKFTEGAPEIEQMAPILRNKEMVDEKVTAYVCLNRSCKAPVTSAQDLLRIIDAA